MCSTVIRPVISLYLWFEVLDQHSWVEIGYSTSAWTGPGLGCKQQYDNYSDIQTPCSCGKAYIGKITRRL